MKICAGLSELAPRYDALLCDVWGVVHNGREAFPVACAALVRPADAASLPAPHQVEISAPNLKLHDQLYRPDGDGPFPIVIALHSCGGLGAHSEAVAPRYRDWAEQLLKAGYAVLLPDSYGSRELG